ncbi:hypothetical protein P7D22_14090 [Lichenihabitans sp. Uapishka_5]|uniref:hypothetical protein n=1 Tax=Lichenihabitans sp. Uapishka_5 TaxID=3037302 RepID=UPI0029E7D5C7|nr:hypothetical protein [Lichenihabitans sp. Uapishka_5]MDX7952299.1 hypothetical protein [Lichenihabitans sp. Uapishka_5]
MNSRRRGRAVVKEAVHCTGPGFDVMLPAGNYPDLIETRHTPVKGGLRSEHVRVLVEVAPPASPERGHVQGMAPDVVSVDLKVHCVTGSVMVLPR